MNVIKLLRKLKSLFDGKLGQWKGPPANIESREGATPIYAKAYPVPHRQNDMLMDEIKRLCKLKVKKE